MIPDKWTYRRYRNDPALAAGDPSKALVDLWRGLFDPGSPDGKGIKGTFDMGGGYVLDLTGSAANSPNGATAVRMARISWPRTPIAGWEYDYAGLMAYAWPSSVDQVPAIVGTVIHAKPHGSGPAGVTASFVAVRHP